MARSAFALTVLTAALTVAVPVFADTTPAVPTPASVAPAASTVITAKRAPFKAQLDLDAVFEAAQTWPLQIDTTVWHVQNQALEVIEALPQGKAVKAGDVVMRFETRWIESAVRDAQLAAVTADTKLRQAEQDAQFAKRLAELEIAAAQRLRDRSEADLQRFLKIDRPLAVDRGEDFLKNSRFALEYSKQELKQLEKMYKADDLTEETEEIILTRQRRAVEAATFALRNMENEIDKTKTVMLPRQQDDLEAALRGTTYALDVQKSVQPLKVNLAEQNLAKAQNEATDAKRRLQDLQHDMAALTLKSPGDGIVYYGHAERGRWMDAVNIDNTIRTGGSFRPKVTLITIVAPRPLRLHSSIVEAALHDLQTGQAGVAIPAAFPDRALPVTIQSIDELPLGAGNDVLIKIDAPAEALADLVPGMSSRVKITYDNPKAIALPLAAIRSDEPGKNYVKVRDAAGTLTDRPVKLGRRSATHVEILDGIAEGDNIETAAAAAPVAVPVAPATEKK